MADISLTASMRSNLLSLQQTQSLMDTTQERLSTGKKVNSAIDNPSSYYTAQSLTNRASDLSSLLDSMGQAVQTIQAANEGIEAITEFASQAKAIANSANDTSDVDSIVEQQRRRAVSDHGGQRGQRRNREVQRQLETLALHLGNKLHGGQQQADEQREVFHLVDEDGIARHHHLPDVAGTHQGDGPVELHEGIAREPAQHGKGREQVPAGLDPLLVHHGFPHGSISIFRSAR